MVTPHDPDFNARAFTLVSAAILLYLAPVWLVVYLAVPVLRNNLCQALYKIADESASWLWLAAAVPVAGYLLTHPVPVDDLLHDMIAWHYQYDYKTMIWGSPRLPHGDPYFGFDHITALIDHAMAAIGLQEWSWLVVTTGLAVLTAGMLVAVLRAAIPDMRREDSIAIALVCASLWLIPDFAQRVRAGRPESFGTVWLAAAMLVNSRRRAVVWLAAGAALIMSYWLAWVYIPAVILTRLSIKNKLHAGAALSSLFLVWWLVVSSGHLFSWYYTLYGISAHRVGVISETISLFAEFLRPGVALFVVLVLASRPAHANKGDTPVPAEHGRNWPAIVLLIWFIFPNMIRYTEVVAVLIAILVMPSIACRCRELLQSGYTKHLVGITLLSFVWAGMSMGGPIQDHAYAWRMPWLPSGSRVLTQSGQDTYAVLFANPTIQVAPAFEMGMSAKQVQSAASNLGKGIVSCSHLHQWHVGAVISPTSAPVDALLASGCLTLKQSVGGHGLAWQVR